MAEIYEKIKNLMRYKNDRTTFNKKYYKITNPNYQPFVGKENYYQGLTAPFVNFYVRKDLTSIDIDSIIIDYGKKYLYIIEDKHLFETKKDSQLKALQLLCKILLLGKSNENFKNWNVGVFYSTFNFDNNTIDLYNVELNDNKLIDFDKYKMFLQGDVLFNEL